MQLHGFLDFVTPEPKGKLKRLEKEKKLEKIPKYNYNEN